LEAENGQEREGEISERIMFPEKRHVEPFGDAGGKKAGEEGDALMSSEIDHKSPMPHLRKGRLQKRGYRWKGEITNRSGGGSLEVVFS